jgi:peroxiredoxin
MPKLQRLHERHAEAGLVVMGVAIDALPEGAREDDRPAKIAKFARRHEVDYPLFLDSADAPAWAAWRVKAVPALFLIDRQGQVVAQWTGEPDQDDVARAVAATLAGSDGQVAP